MAYDLFAVASDTKHGKTLYVENPKKSAIQQAGYIRILGRSADITSNSDGSFTVRAYMLESITYSPKTA